MKKSFEQTALVVSLFAMGIILIGGSFVFESIEKPKPNSSLKEVVVFDPSQYDTLSGKIFAPTTWPLREHKLFVSRLLAYTPVLHTTRYLQLDDVGPDGITYRWKKEHGLSMDDPTVATADSDGDGFTNLEEYKANTDPNDNESSPPPVIKLRLEKFAAIPFKLIFRGYTVDSNNKYTFQINMQNKTILVKEGDFINLSQFKVDRSGWRIGEFKIIKEEISNPTTGGKDEVDKSELTLYHPLLEGQKITMVRNMPIESDESRVDLMALIPNVPSITQIAKGQVFEFKGKKYQLLKSTPQGVELKDVETGTVIPVAPVTPEEKEKLTHATASTTGQNEQK